MIRTPRDEGWSLTGQKARLLLACGLFAAVALLVVIPLRIREDGYLTYVSGAWAALADDVARGVLYRPIVSDLGYGGTRYFPLHFVLHGGLERLGLSLVSGGHLISLLAALGVIAGGALGLGRQGVPWTLACVAGVLALASRTAFVGVAGIRGDVLPLAFGLLGVALTPRSKNETAAWSVLFLVLALLTKPTLVWAPAAAMLAMTCAGRAVHAIKLGLMVVCGLALGLLAAHLWSKGEMLRSFGACATGGGLSFAWFPGGFKLARPGEVTWVIGGMVFTVMGGWRALSHPLAAAFVTCLPVTWILYSSPGLHINHFIDLVALGALRVGAGVWEFETRQWPRVFIAAATVLGVVEGVLLHGMVIRRGDFEAVIRELPKGRAPLLSEQPWIPLLAGERPYVLDAFNLMLIRKASKEVRPLLLDSLGRCAFRAVVLNGTAESAEWWYAEAAFGEPFRAKLLENYTYSKTAGGHAIYLPTCGAPRAPANPVALVGHDTVLHRGGQPNAARLALQRLIQAARSGNAKQSENSVR